MPALAENLFLTVMGATIAAEGFSRNGSIAKRRFKLKCLLVLDSEILEVMITQSGRK